MVCTLQYYNNVNTFVCKMYTVVKHKVNEKSWKKVDV